MQPGMPAQSFAPSFPPQTLPGFPATPPANSPFSAPPGFNPATFGQPPQQDLFAPQTSPQAPGAPAGPSMDPAASGASTSLADTSSASGGLMSTTMGKVGTAIAVGIPLIWGGERLVHNKGIFGFLIRSTETALADLAEGAKTKLSDLAKEGKSHFEKAKTNISHEALGKEKDAVEKLFSDAKAALKGEKQQLQDGPKKAHDEYHNALKEFFDGKLKALKDNKAFEKETEFTQAVNDKHRAYETAFAEVFPKEVSQLPAEVKTHFNELDKNVKTLREQVEGYSKKEDHEAAKKAQAEITTHFNNANKALSDHKILLAKGPAEAYQKYVEAHTNFLNDKLEALEKGDALGADKVNTHFTAITEARNQFKKVFTEAADAATPKVTNSFSKLNDEAKTFINETHDTAAHITEKIKGFTSKDEVEKSKKELEAAFDAGKDHISHLEGEDSQKTIDALKKAHLDYHNAKLKSLTDKTAFDHDAHQAEITTAHTAYEKKFAPLLHQKMEAQMQHSKLELGKATRAYDEAIAKSVLASRAQGQALVKTLELEKELEKKSKTLVAARQELQAAKTEVEDRQSDLADAPSSSAASKEVDTARKERGKALKKLATAEREFKTADSNHKAAKAELEQAEKLENQAKAQEAKAKETLFQRQDDFAEDEQQKQRLAKLLPTAS